MKVSLPYTGLACIYCVLLLMDMLLEIKVIDIYGIELTPGALSIVLAYMVSNCLVEVYGFAKSRLVVWFGFVLMILMALILKGSTLIPSLGWEGNDHYNYIFGLSPRVGISCLLAFLIGGYVNDALMTKMRVLWQGKYFQGRVVLATLAGGTADVLVGYFGIFYGLIPIENILRICLTMVVIRVLAETALLPVTTSLVQWIRKYEPEEKVIKDPSNYNFFPKSLI